MTLSDAAMVELLRWELDMVRERAERAERERLEAIVECDRAQLRVFETLNAWSRAMDRAEQAEKELAARLAPAGVCPTCGRGAARPRRPRRGVGTH